MAVLNLIRPENSEIKYNIIQFPDGEPHIVLGEIDRKKEVDVLCRITNPTDLFILMQVGDILNRQGVLFNLSILYLMSMRMDRVISYNEAFSLSIVTQVINDMFPMSVGVLEPHSSRTKWLIDSRWKELKVCKPDFISRCQKVFPDEGAALRYGANPYEDIICSKVRDKSTGQLSGFKIENLVVLHNCDKPFIVIDDLCDGGGTFKGIAQLLKEECPDRERHIYVTHMVNPKGIATLSENYNKVYFTNSYKDWDKEELPSNVEVIHVV